MPTVAEQLRTAREAQSLTVYQVAEITKIKTDHVRALEEGNYNTFSAPVYIRGFVRTYSNVLKLDVRSVMAELEAELRALLETLPVHARPTAIKYVASLPRNANGKVLRRRLSPAA